MRLGSNSRQGNFIPVELLVWNPIPRLLSSSTGASWGSSRLSFLPVTGQECQELQERKHRAEICGNIWAWGALQQVLFWRCLTHTARAPCDPCTPATHMCTYIYFETLLCSISYLAGALKPFFSLANKRNSWVSINVFLNSLVCDKIAK